MIELKSACIKGVNIPHEGAYADSPAISRSDLLKIDACPHKWKFGPKSDDASEAVKWGSLIDAMLFNVGIDRFVISPETYADKDGNKKPWNNNATVCRQWNDYHADKEIIRQDLYDRSVYAVAKLKLNNHVSSLLEASQFQVWVEGVYHCTETGLDVTVKGLADIVPNDGCVLYDLKTTSDGSASKWWRKCEDHGYHVQAALYADLFSMALQREFTAFRHIVQENEEPYEVAIYELDSSSLRLGQAVYKRAIEKYALSTETGIWPGLTEDAEKPVIITPDAYAVLRAGVQIEDSKMPF